MKSFILLPFGAAIVAACSLAWALNSLADDQKPAQPPVTQPPCEEPVVIPLLAHYKGLWERSLFTSHTVPKPPVSGPSFADALSLAGIYDIGGRIIAVLVDKDSSQILEVTTETNSINGMVILAVDHGTSPYQARVQIQRGSESGWVGIPESVQTAGATSPSARSPQSMQTKPPQPAPVPVIEEAHQPNPLLPPLPLHNPVQKKSAAELPLPLP